VQVARGGNPVAEFSVPGSQLALAQAGMTGKQTIKQGKRAQARLSARV